MSLAQRLRRRRVGEPKQPWRVVWAGSAVQLLVGALLLHSYGAYVVLLRQEFGWSRTMLSAAYSMMRVESGLLGPLQGWVIDRFGPRAVMRVGIVMFGIGFLLFSRLDSPVTFFLTFALMALGASLCGWLSVVVSVVRSFNHRRATAMAIAKVGVAVGGLLVSLVALALAQFGWRATAFASGVILLVVGPVLTQFVEPARERPRAPEPAAPGTAGAADGAAPPPPAPTAPSGDFSARQAVRTRAFWMLSFGHATSVLVVGALLVHLIPHLTETLGYSLRQAGLVVSALTAMQLVGVLSGGWLGDRISKRAIIVVCMGMHFVGLLLVTYALNVAMVLAFTVIHGLAWGARAPLIQALRADYFGSASFGTIAGWSSLIVAVGQTSGPIVAGVLSDVTGSYRPGFTALAITSLLGSVFFLAATPPTLPEQEPPEPAGEPVISPT